MSEKPEGMKNMNAWLYGEDAVEKSEVPYPPQVQEKNPDAPGALAFKRQLLGESRDFAVLPTTIEEGLDRLNLPKSATFTDALKTVEDMQVENQTQRKDLLAFWKTLSTLLLNESEELARLRMKEADK